MSAAPGSQGGATELERYTLTSPLEIVHHLRGLAQAGVMLTVYSNQGKNCVLTRVLAADAQTGTLVFDWGGNEAANRILLACPHNVFACAPDGIKTQFSTGQPREIEFEGRPAFEAALPAAMIRLQRREMFRVKTPLANPVYCRVLDHPAGELLLPLFDISIGGMALDLPEHDLAGFDYGQRYADCSVDLPGLGVLPVGIEVRNRRALTLTNGNPATRVGCQFLNMSTAREGLVQRYVAQLERERRALTR